MESYTRAKILFSLNINDPNFGELLKNEQVSPYYIPKEELIKIPELEDPGESYSSRPHFVPPTLLEVALNGYLVRTSPKIQDTDCPCCSRIRKNYKNKYFVDNNQYSENAVVVCDYCNKRGLVTYIHYGKLDLCLPCMEEIFKAK